MSTNSEQPSGSSMSPASPDGRRVLGDLRFDELQLAALELRQVEQLVDRDVLLDGASDHARRADDLVHAEVPEELLVLRVVDARDGARHVEMVLRHLADDEVVLVVAGHRGDDGRAVGAGLGEVLALAAVALQRRSAELVGDLARPALSFSMSTTSWPARAAPWSGSSRPAAADDDDEHQLMRPPVFARPAVASAALHPAGDVVQGRCEAWIFVRDPHVGRS